MRRSRGKLAVVCGLDGCGKTTLLSRLRRRGFVTSYWRDLARVPGVGLNFENPGEEVCTLRGSERYRYQSAFLAEEWCQLISPELARGRDVISDGFFARIYAKEKCFGEVDAELFRRFEPLPPVHFVFLDVAPEVALGRKDSTTPFEGGGVAAEVLAFQERLQIAYRSLVAEYDFDVVSGEGPPAEVASEVIEVLRRRGFRTARPASPGRSTRGEWLLGPSESGGRGGEERA